MAKKKSAKKTAAAKDFSNSPFKNLKGLSAFETRESVAERPLPEKREDDKSASTDEESSFADEMAFLGVNPLSGKGLEESDAREGRQPAKTGEVSDQAVFLDALGSMEKVFKDEWQEEETEQRAPARRMRQVERGQLKPEAELDLHGLTVDEATSKVRFFLQNAIFHKFKTILIITGKGLHSSDGPVLRLAVEKLLASLREQVAEWGVAPRRYGGDGALIVFLRDKKG